MTGNKFDGDKEFDAWMEAMSEDRHDLLTARMVGEDDWEDFTEEEWEKRFTDTFYAAFVNDILYGLTANGLADTVVAEDGSHIFKINDAGKEALINDPRS